MSVKIGLQLPDWSLEKIGGTIVPQLKDFKGKPLLILFFNLGCPGCKGRALPFANWVNLEYKDKINVVGIHTNFEGVDFTDEQLINCKSEFYLNFPYFRDKNYNTTFIDYEAGGTPHWILVDKDNHLNYSIFGSDPNNALLRLDLKIQELTN